MRPLDAPTLSPVPCVALPSQGTAQRRASFLAKATARTLLDGPELGDRPAVDRDHEPLAGTDLAHVVKTTVYLVDIATFAEMNGVYETFHSGNPEGDTNGARIWTGDLPTGPGGEAVPLDIDVRGMRAVEAEEALERYLREAGPYTPPPANVQLT